MSSLLGSLRRRNPLPEGAASVGVGLGVLGLTSYGFLVISGRVLGPVQIAPVSSLWAIVFTAGPGVFLPLEQEVSRLVASRSARGVGARPVVRRIGAIGAAAAGLLVIAGIATASLTVGPLFQGQELLLVGLLLAVVGFAGEHLLRGVLSGVGRFGRYGMVLAAEGVVRLVACGMLAVLGVAAAGPYGVVLGAAPLGSWLVGVRRGGWLRPGPAVGWSEVSGALGWLLGGSVLSQGLANAALLAAPLLAGAGEQAVVGAFLASFVVARVPLFVFSAVQAALLPHLSRLAGQGQLEAFRSSLRRLIALVAGIGIAGAVAAFAFGPWVVRVLFGSAFELERMDLFLLAAGAGAYMVALAYAQAVIALGEHARAAAGFGLGLLVSVAGFAIETDRLALRLEIGFLMGSVAAAAAMAFSVRQYLERRATS